MHGVCTCPAVRTARGYPVLVNWHRRACGGWLGRGDREPLGLLCVRWEGINVIILVRICCRVGCSYASDRGEGCGSDSAGQPEALLAV